jgi:small subunit ribosomal protein S4e|tara:strand:+ start:785 stop:1486 length:702 start_codon:yes stop_codon:yes gene_type:complete
MKSHLKRLPAPRSWSIQRKGLTYITRPLPGKHSIERGMPLVEFFKVLVEKATTKKEVKKIMYSSKVLVDGAQVKEEKYLVGLMDVISLEGSKEHYRLLLNSGGELFALAIPAKEASLKPVQIIGKTLLAKGKIQLNMGDGRNLLVDKNAYTVGDTLLLELPKQAIKEHFAYAKGALAYFTGGRFVGKTGTIEDIKDNRIICKVDGNVVETMKHFAYIIGKGKSSISLEEGKKE